MKTSVGTMKLFWPVVFAAAILFSGYHLQSTLILINGMPDIWNDSVKWIESAECARQTGVLLVGCIDGTIIPYSELSLADDVGHALILGLYSMASGKSLVLDHAAVLNTLINFSGVGLLVAVLTLSRQYWLAIAVLVVGSVVISGSVSVTPHAALYGVVCFAMLLPIVLINFRRDKLWLFIPMVALALIALCLATLLRQSIGMMGAIATLISLAAALPSTPGRRLGLVALTAVCVLISTNITTGVLATRDAIWSVRHSEAIDRHGVQHNLFIGLGAVPNKFGIEWNDTYGWDAARKVSPTVGYVSNEYYRILGNEYIKTVLSDPIEVVRIYAVKLWVFLVTQLTDPFWFGVPLFLALLSAYCILLWRRIGQWSALTEDGAIVVSTTFILMHLAQAAIIHPSMQYGAPIALLMIVVLGAAVQNAVRAKG